MIKKEKEREEDIIKEEKVRRNEQFLRLVINNVYQIRKEQLVKQKFLGFFSKPDGNQVCNVHVNLNTCLLYYCLFCRNLITIPIIKEQL